MRSPSTHTSPGTSSSLFIPPHPFISIGEGRFGANTNFLLTSSFTYYPAYRDGFSSSLPSLRKVYSTSSRAFKARSKVSSLRSSRKMPVRRDVICARTHIQNNLTAHSEENR
nr:MAG TPA: hypothetical protein [Caudoviricetes sp.]